MDKRTRLGAQAVAVLVGAAAAGCGARIDAPHPKTVEENPAMSGEARSTPPYFAGVGGATGGSIPPCSGEFCAASGGARQTSPTTPGRGSSNHAAAGAGGGDDGGAGVTGVVLDGGRDAAPFSITYQTGSSRIDVFTVLAGDAGSDGLLDLTTDRSGNVWFTTQSAVGRMTPSGDVTLFPVQLEDVAGYPWSIVTGSDGNLWFSRSDGVNITRVTTEGVMTEFPLPPTPISWLGGPTLVPGAGTLWFSAQEFGYIGSMSPTGAVSEIPIGASDTTALAVVSGGALWFDTSYQPDGGSAYVYRIARRVPDGTTQNFAVPPTVGPMVVDGDEALWFAEIDVGKIGRLTPDGTVVEVAVQRGGDPSWVFGVDDITTDATGNLWFVEPVTSAIARVDVATGVLTEFPISDPTSASWVMPIRLTVGSDGAVWFTRSIVNGGFDQSCRTIGRLTPG